jgi:hypothetical protein
MKTTREILQKYLDADNTPMKGNEWILDAMEEYADQFRASVKTDNAVGFAEWILKNQFVKASDGRYSWWDDDENIKSYSSEQLYTKYLETLPPQEVKTDNAVGWISVDERLPEKDGYYLCAKPKADIQGICKTDVYIYEFENGAFGNDVLAKLGIDLTPNYWMPLPNLPKE